MVERPGEVGSGHRVVHHQGDAVAVADGGDGVKVDDVQFGVADGFHEKCLGLRRDGTFPGVHVVGGNEAHGDAQSFQGVGKQAHRAAVELCRGHDLVAGLGQGQKGQRLRRLSRSHGQGSHSAFQLRHPLFEHLGGGVHDAGVDIAELAKAEKIRGVLGAVKCERGSLV
jgi:hypothetical protein